MTTITTPPKFETLMDLGEEDSQDVLDLEDLNKTEVKIMEKQILNTIPTLLDSTIKYYSVDHQVGVSLSAIRKMKEEAQLEVANTRALTQEQLVKMINESVKTKVSFLPHPPTSNMQLHAIPQKQWPKRIAQMVGKGVQGDSSLLIPETLQTTVTVNNEAIYSNQVNTKNIFDKKGETKTEFIFIPNLESYWIYDKIKGKKMKETKAVYFPKPFKVKNDKQILKQMRRGIQTYWTYFSGIEPETLWNVSVTAMKQDDLHFAEEFYKDLCKTVESNFFGNGSLFGQLGRYKACKEINDYAKANYAHNQTTPQKIVDFISKHILCTNTNPIIEIKDSKSMDYLEISEALIKGGHKGLEINADAGDGLLWPKEYKKGDTILSDISLATRYLLDLSDGNVMAMLSALRANSVNAKSIDELMKSMESQYDLDEQDSKLLRDYLKNTPNKDGNSNFDHIKLKNGEEGKLLYFHTKDMEMNKTKRFNLGLSKERFWQKWAFLRIAKMKPKAEVYENGLDNPKSEVIKTRNYWESNLTIHLPFVILTNWLLGNKPNPVDNYDCHSMTGWTPVQGGINGIMTRIQTKNLDHKKNNNGAIPPKGYLIDWFIFCDNLFLAVADGKGDWHWYSLDGSKMEASSESNFLKKFAGIYALFFKGKISSTLQQYLNIVTPVALGGLISVLGSAMWIMSFLSSGSVGTSVVNHFKMAETMMFLQDFLDNKQIIFDDEHKFTSVFKDALKLSGVQLKIERVQTEVMYNIKKGNYLNLDLLGFGGIPATIPSLLGEPKNPNSALDNVIVFPYLAKERMKQMLAFTKLPATVSKEDPNSPRNLVIRLLKMKLAYVYGLWTEPGISTLIELMHKDLVLQIRNIESSLLDVKIDAKSMQQFLEESDEIFGIQTVINALRDFNVPSLLTIIKLGVSTSTFKETMKHIADSLPVYMENGYISPDNIEDYMGRNEIKQLNKEIDKGSLPERLNYTVLGDLKIADILNFSNAVRSLKVNSSFSFAKNPGKVLRTVDLSISPYTTIKKISLDKISLLQLKLLYTTEIKFYKTPIKVIMNTVNFAIKLPMTNLFAFLYSIYCYYLHNISGIPLHSVMAMVKDFPMTCFDVGMLALVLRTVRAQEANVRSIYTGNKYSLIEDENISEIPEFLYLYLYYIGKSYIPTKKSKKKRFEKEKLDKGKIKKKRSNKKDKKEEQIEEKITLKKKKKDRIPIYKDLQQLYLEDSLFHHYPFKLEDQGTKFTNLLEYNEDIVKWLTDFSKTFLEFFDQKRKGLLLSYPALEGLSLWGDTAETPYTVSQYYKVVLSRLNFYTELLYLINQGKKSEIPKLIKLYNREWEEYSHYSLSMKWDINPSDDLKIQPKLSIQKYANINRFLQGSITNVIFEKLTNSTSVAFSEVGLQSDKIARNFDDLKELFK